MNSLRAVKRSKRILKKVPTQDESPEEEAKQKLIELSNMWDYNQTQPNFEDNPQEILEDVKNKAQSPEPRKNFNTPRTRCNISVDFKKLTQLLEDRQDIDLLEIRSERHYKYGDRFIKIALRNPLITSNYIMTGANHEKVSVSNPQRSQYVIRQQRNSSRIRREQLRKNSVNVLSDKFTDEPLSSRQVASNQFSARTQILNSALRSQSVSLHDNQFSAKLRSDNGVQTSSYLRNKK